MEASRKDVFLLVLGLLPAVVVATFAIAIVPSCIAVYAPVADQLPLQTRFVFVSYYLCTLLPLSVLGVWYFWRKSRGRGLYTASFGILLSGGALAFGYWAVYQPELILRLIRRG